MADDTTANDTANDTVNETAKGGNDERKEKHKKTILVMEDSSIQAFALAHFLEQQGLKVLHAANGRIGVRMAQQHKPDAIVLDIEMPEMDGFEACIKLKEDPRTAEIPVVMFTIRSEPEMVLQGIDTGAIDFIPKDAFSYTVLLKTLQQLGILEESRIGNES